jgi:hypothetical protein
MPHNSIKTLLDAIEQSEGRRYTHSELARALNVSEQVITNWAKRGISVEGALAAQSIFHKDANYVLGRSRKPAMLPASQFNGNVEPLQAREPTVAYMPEPKLDKLQTELLRLFSLLDDNGKNQWLGDLRGFVRAMRPHPHGAAPALAGKK